MSIQVIICDYTSSAGENLIADWMNRIGPRPKARFNAHLTNLRTVPLDQWHTHKPVEILHKERGLVAIKAFVDKVQWRLIGCFGPGEGAFTLLIGAKEKGNKLEPASTYDKAHERKSNVESNPREYRRRHVW